MFVTLCVAASNQNGLFWDSPLLQARIVYTNTIIVHINSRHYYYCAQNSSSDSQSMSEGYHYTILDYST